MALSDPQSITIGSAISLPRISDSPDMSTYQSADGLVKLTASQRRSSSLLSSMFRVDKTVLAADPVSAQNRYVVGSVYVVTQFPISGIGFTTADKIAMYAGLNTQLTASTNAVLTAILTGQH